MKTPQTIQDGPKSKPLPPNYRKFVLNRIKA